ncbi:MAG: 3-deoxy-7-phosphoheptulonate synthase [Candidatus Saccharimonadales bacterium]
MSPETGNIHKSTILAEAEMISQELTGVQYEAAAAFEHVMAERLSNSRERFDDQLATPVDQSTAVDTNNVEPIPVITPAMLEAVLPLTQESLDTTVKARNAIGDILTGKSDRLLVVVGPCSIHDPESAIAYAHEVKKMREEYGEYLEIVMRFYPEKPRTELGWKGLIYDPRLDQSNDINLGVTLSRLLACQITNMGVPIAMERLNAYTPQYFNGLVAYDAIGARNTTDQKAREYASGTSSPVGFKNTPEGSVKAATEAVKVANAPHVFLGINTNGLPMQVQTTGNNLAHVILRGDQQGPNYSPEHLEKCLQRLQAKELLNAIVIDASHGNNIAINPITDEKDPVGQIEVIKDVSKQKMLGQVAICGVMIESNLLAGKQEFTAGETDISQLEPGLSITDAGVGVPDTKRMLGLLQGAVIVRHTLE